jgi:hypothetical protein
MSDLRSTGFGVKITCDKCGFIDYPWGPHLLSNPQPKREIYDHVYDLGNDKIFPVLDEKAWCLNCGKTTSFEIIPSDTQISEHIKKHVEYIDKHSDVNDEDNWERIHSDLYRKYLLSEPLWRAWAKQRDSTRCLICGSQERIDIDFSKPDKLAFSHPGCGGILRISEDEFDRDNYISFQWKRIYEHELILIKYNPDGTKIEANSKNDLDNQLDIWLNNRKKVLERCESLRKNGGLGVSPDPAKVDPDHLEEPLRSMAKKTLGIVQQELIDPDQSEEPPKADIQNDCAQAIATLDDEWPEISPFIKFIIKRIHETRGALKGIEAEEEYIAFKDNFDDIPENVTRICLIETYSLNPRRQGYYDAALQEFSEDYPDLHFAIIEAARCLIAKNLLYDIKTNGKVSNEMSLQYDWISQTTPISNNPFFLLGATPEDNSGRIVELADERSLEIDSSKCTKARTDLINPRNRLAAEMRYMPGCSRETILILWKKIHAGHVSLLQNPDLPSLAKANLVASAIQLLPPETPPRLRGEWIIDLAYTATSIEANEVIEDINQDRTKAGFPQVQSKTDIENILSELIREYRDAVKTALNKLPPNDLVETVTYAVSVASNHGETSCPLLIDELVDGYETEAKSTLQKGVESILHLIESIQEDAGRDPSAIQPSINKLMSSVRSWDRLAQPIQVSHKSRGLDHDLSHQLAWSIRNLAIDLFKNHGMLEIADNLTDLSKEIFAELPEVARTLEKDSEALEEIYQKRLKEKDDQKAWEKDITYKTELGVIFKDVLAISPKGIQWKNTVYRLEDVNRIRWGATKHYTNGIPTGTTYTIAFGNQNGMSSVETRDINVYNTFIDKLWKAVGVRLVTQLLEGLEAGKEYTWDGVTIDKNGVKIVIRRLLLSDLEGYRPWKDIIIDHANGCLVVYFKNDNKLHRELSYQNLNNIHVLEMAMNLIMKQQR